MSGWNTDQVPDQSGRRVVVTGASCGLGEITARELARKGAQVVLAVRSTSKGEASAQRIHDAIPGALVEVAELDLSALESVRAFAAGLLAQWPTQDLLVNNAGIMMTPRAGPPTGTSCSSAPTISVTSRSPGSCSKHWVVAPGHGW
ncbi:MAG: SDR family NAD(P)-dependent oxidoreductase [Actinomycetota bacterium]